MILWRDVALADKSNGFEPLEAFIGSITFTVAIECHRVGSRHNARFKKAAQQGKVAVLKLQCIRLGLPHDY